MKQIHPQHWSARLGGYFLIPHELLHLAGFWLVGKRCRYQWGDSFVLPIDPINRRERLVGLLFPFIVCSGLMVIFGLLSTVAYGFALRGSSFFWFVLWTGLSLITGIYAGTAITDLRKAYLLILDKPWHSWTPFDIFFWPVVDWTEVRRKISVEEKDEQG